MTTFLIVDMANLIHRCKHVTMGDIATRAGMALHITLNSFRQSWRKFQTDHVVVSLESRSWRKDYYAGYKANRAVLDAVKTKKEREDDEFYFKVFENFVEFLEKRTNVTVLRSEGAEADDLIARFIDIHPNDKHVILSGDSDFYQLLADNVTIYDGVKGWTITTKSVLDENDQPAYRSKLMPKRDSNGKIMKDKNGKPFKETVKIYEEPPQPEYELFKKIIRGDSTDNVHCAYPGVLEKGSSKKPGIKHAFDDRKGRGFHWNEFMLTEWDKVIDAEDDGTPITTKVRVLDEYKFNQALIDLRAQPQEIKDNMDQAIVNAITLPVKSGVGIWFLKFCNEMDLVNISKTPNEYATLLAAPYPKANT